MYFYSIVYDSGFDFIGERERKREVIGVFFLIYIFI